MQTIGHIMATNSGEIVIGSSASATMQKLPQVSAVKQNLTERYGGWTDFLQTFHVVKQESYTRLPERCYFGSAPTLQHVNKDYGRGTAEEWLLYQLDDLSEYCGARDKLTKGQMRSLAQLLTQEYGWLNVAEFMLFFRRFKLGRYGRFYGSVDPMAITIALKERFLPERYEAYERKEQEEREHEREEKERNAITYVEYLEMKRSGKLKNL